VFFSKPRFKIRVVYKGLNGPKSHFREHKEAALILVTQKVAEFNKYYNFRLGNIRVKNTKTRWGSCSRVGNLNFHYKILMLPPELADYVIVHEICHLKHFNHSRNFWDEVEKMCPNCKEKAKKLRSLSPQL
jgi:hypothetical protein